MYSVLQNAAGDYFFTTIAGITYKLSFTELDTYTFPALRRPQRFCLVDVFPTNTAWDVLPVEDPGIGATVGHLIRQEIVQRNIAILFSCETSDQRERARHRKFSRWFFRYNDGTFLKYDADISTSTQRYLVSLLVQHGPDSYMLVEDFMQTIGVLSAPKPQLD